MLVDPGVLIWENYRKVRSFGFDVISYDVTWRAPNRQELPECTKQFFWQKKIRKLIASTLFHKKPGGSFKYFFLF